MTAFRPERAFLVLGLCAGMLFLFLTPPMQVPDEPAHLYRAYQVSEGRLRGERLGFESGGVLPRSVPASAEVLDQGVAFHPDRRVDPRVVLAEIRRPLAPQDRAFVAFPGSVVYSPVPYIPQGIALAAGRWMGLPPLGLIYLGRLANLLAGVWLAWMAIRLTPVLKPAFLLLALMPMSVFQRSSLSADACTNGLALLIAALALEMAFGAGGPVRLPRKLLFVALSALLALCKPMYLTVPLLSLMIPPGRLGGRGPTLLFLGILLGTAAGASIGWARAVQGIYTPYWVGCDPGLQIRHLVTEPRAVLGIARDALACFPRLLLGMVGVMGWLDTRLPVSLRVAYLAALALAAAWEPEPGIRFGIRARAFAISLFALSYLLIGVLIFVLATPVGALSIKGLQARYLIPVAPIALLALFRSMPPPAWMEGRLGRLSAGFSALALAVAAAVLVRRYY